MAAYRIRRCKACYWEGPAGELLPVRFGAGHWHSKGGSLRKCPACGATGFTQDFPVIEDLRKPAEAGNVRKHY